jgi:hypothetical protein
LLSFLFVNSNSAEFIPLATSTLGNTTTTTSHAWQPTTHHSAPSPSCSSLAHSTAILTTTFMFPHLMNQQQNMTAGVPCHTWNLMSTTVWAFQNNVNRFFFFFYFFLAY